MLFVSQLVDMLANIYVILNIVFYEEMSADWLVLYGLKGLGGTTQAFFAMTSSILTDTDTSSSAIIFIEYSHKLCCHISTCVHSLKIFKYLLLPDMYNYDLSHHFVKIAERWLLVRMLVANHLVDCAGSTIGSSE